MIQHDLQPGACRDLGHIYVVQFSSELLKVGLTKNAPKRMKAHRDAANRHRHTVTRSWLSPAHVNFIANEQALIRFCTDQYGEPYFGKETFQSARFDDVVSFAESLPHVQHHTRATGIGRVRIDEQVVYTAMVNGEPHVVLRPTLNGIGIDFSAQLQKLQGRSWAARSMGRCVTRAADGKARSMVTISLEGWSMLLANIDENRVKPQAAEMIVAFQERSASALKRFWNDYYVFRTLPQQIALEELSS